MKKVLLVVAAFVWRITPDTPPSVRLPEVEGTGKAEEQSQAEFKAFVIERVFKNKYIWIVSIANFFVYIIRYAVLDWGPTMLTQAKHIKIAHAAWMVAGFEFGGLLGALFGGWITDRFLRGRAVRVCFVYMLLAGVSIFVFWKISVQSELLMAGILAAAGFFICVHASLPEQNGDRERPKGAKRLPSGRAAGVRS